MEYKITKIELIRKNCNNLVGRQWYYLVHCRVFADSEHKGFWRRRFVMMFDGDDLWEHYHDEENPEDNPNITEKMIKEYKQESAWSMAESFIGYNKTIQEVTEECNATINDYNKVYGYTD